MGGRMLPVGMMQKRTVPLGHLFVLYTLSQYPNQVFRFLENVVTQCQLYLCSVLPAKALRRPTETEMGQKMSEYLSRSSTHVRTSVAVIQSISTKVAAKCRVFASLTSKEEGGGGASY